MQICESRGPFAPRGEPAQMQVPAEGVLDFQVCPRFRGASFNSSDPVVRTLEHWTTLERRMSPPSLEGGALSWSQTLLVRIIP